MSRRLPPLSALRAFEAAARHGSFKHAAAELAVTPTAISHQIRAIEDYVGIAFFERRTRRVVLTDAGARLFPVLRDGFDAFADVIEGLTRTRSRTQVTIAATLAFTALWLVPRLLSFRTRYPDYDIHLLASDDVIDLAKANVDIAIRYGSGDYQEFEVVPLFADRFAPVCNPMLKIEDAGDLAQRPLIEFEWRRRHPNNPTWARWFAAAGLSAPDAPPLMRFSDESHAIQAAVAGQGVALASLALVRDELEAGRLVQPLPLSIAGFHHHMLMKHGSRNPAVTAVASWLLSEVEALEPPS